jgi:hypothetical protein
VWPDHRVAVTVGDEEGVSDRADTLQCTMIGNAPVARRCFHASYRRSFTYSGDPPYGRVSWRGKLRRSAMGSPTVIRDLEGKVVLVTGATSGIGEATAVQLARQGAAVIVHGRDVTCGAAVVTEIEKSSGSAWFVGADLSEPAEALRLAGAVGDVDILVNNAGFAWFGPSDKLPVDTRAASSSDVGHPVERVE